MCVWFKNREWQRLSSFILTLAVLFTNLCYAGVEPTPPADVAPSMVCDSSQKRGCITIATTPEIEVSTGWHYGHVDYCEAYTANSSDYMYCYMSDLRLTAVMTTNYKDFHLFLNAADSGHHLGLYYDGSSWTRTVVFNF